MKTPIYTTQFRCLEGGVALLHIVTIPAGTKLN